MTDSAHRALAALILTFIPSAFATAAITITNPASQRLVAFLGSAAGFSALIVIVCAIAWSWE